MSLVVSLTRPASTNRIESPGFSPVAVPVSHSEVLTVVQSTGLVVIAGSALCAIRAMSGAAVSNVTGCWPGAGTLCTRVPASITTGSGEPAASFSVKASGADAATPGEGR